MFRSVVDSAGNLVISGNFTAVDGIPSSRIAILQVAPVLDIPDDVQANADDTVAVPVNFGGGDGIVATAFTVDYDACLVLADPFVTLSQTAADRQLTYDVDSQEPNQVRVVIGPAPGVADDALPPFVAGELLQLHFDTGGCSAGATAAVTFAADSLSFGNSSGQGVSGTGTGGSVLINTPPTANDDSALLTEDAIITIPVLTNDTDADGDPLTLQSLDLTGVTGSVTDNGDGTVTYDPNGQFDYLPVGAEGNESFTYTISDGRGGTDTATVAVTITGVNDDPVGVADIFDTDEDTPATVNVIENDSDPDLGNVPNLSGLDDSTTQGSVSVNGNEVTYTPPAAFQSLAQGELATDSFTYSISDGNGGSDTVTIELTVIGVNDVPVAEAGPDRWVGVGETLNVTGSVTDPDDSDTHTFTIDWGDGATVDDVSGSHSYSARNDYTLSFTARDPFGGSNTDTATVFVRTRGDCNDDGPVDAGDLPALVLEYFDGDNSDNWLDTLGVGSTFAGNPVGCNANADTKITAGDLSCQINILLDPAGYSCAGTTAASAAQAVLSLAAVDAAQSGPIRVPVTLQTNGHAVVAAVFSLDLGGAAFDAADANADGIPDAVTVLVSGDVQVMALYDPTDMGSELDLVLFSDSLTPFADGELLSVTLTNAGTVTFSADSAASLGAADGSSVPVLAQEGVTAERKLYLPFTTR